MEQHSYDLVSGLQYHVELLTTAEGITEGCLEFSKTHTERLILRHPIRATDALVARRAMQEFSAALFRTPRGEMAARFPDELLPIDDGDPTGLPSPWAWEDAQAVLQWDYKRVLHTARVQRDCDAADGRRYFLRVVRKYTPLLRCEIVAATLADACDLAMFELAPYQRKRR
jgi:hypothetical protein